MHFLWETIRLLPSWMLVGLVRAYQMAISPLLGPTCRFQPTCSEYFILAVRKYGAVSGALRGIRRSPQATGLWTVSATSPPHLTGPPRVRLEFVRPPQLMLSMTAWRFPQV